LPDGPDVADFAVFEVLVPVCAAPEGPPVPPDVAPDFDDEPAAVPGFDVLADADVAEAVPLVSLTLALPLLSIEMVSEAFFVRCVLGGRSA
jgi:hypothetical protein